MDGMLIALIVVAVVLVAVVLGVIIHKSVHREDDNDPFATTECNLKVKDAYLNKSEAYFYAFVNKHLSSQYYIMAKVGVDNLVDPTNYDLRQYNAIKAKYIDFVIFDSKEQKPIVAIDLVERSVGSKNPYFDKDIAAALGLIKLPIWTKFVEHVYVWELIEGEFKKYLPQNDKEEVAAQDKKEEQTDTSATEIVTDLEKDKKG